MSLEFKSAKDRVVLSLDVDSKDKAIKLVKDLKDYVGTFKVGMQLFHAEGPEIIRAIHDEGGRIFYDGKFHDIPNTVARASESIIEHGITFFNLHILGGSKMMKACVEAANDRAKEKDLPKPIILGVTILTSLGQRTLTQELGVESLLGDYIVKLAKLAKESGLSGVVASASEAKEIRKACGDKFVILTPAIRPTWAALNDQIRVLTPRDAIRSGSNFLVVGRPITQARDPVAAAQLILDEIDETIENGDS